MQSDYHSLEICAICSFESKSGECECDSPRYIRICVSFSMYGSCSWGSQCQFKHIVVDKTKSLGVCNNWVNFGSCSGIKSVQNRPLLRRSDCAAVTSNLYNVSGILCSYTHPRKLCGVMRKHIYSNESIVEDQYELPFAELTEDALEAEFYETIDLMFSCYDGVESHEQLVPIVSDVIFFPSEIFSHIFVCGNYRVEEMSGMSHRIVVTNSISVTRGLCHCNYSRYRCECYTDLVVVKDTYRYIHWWGGMSNKHYSGRLESKWHDLSDDESSHKIDVVTNIIVQDLMPWVMSTLVSAFTIKDMADLVASYVPEIVCRTLRTLGVSDIPSHSSVTILGKQHEKVDDHNIKFTLRKDCLRDVIIDSGKSIYANVREIDILY